MSRRVRKHKDKKNTGRKNVDSKEGTGGGEGRRIEAKKDKGVKGKGKTVGKRKPGEEKEGIRSKVRTQRRGGKRYIGKMMKAERGRPMEEQEKRKRKTGRRKKDERERKGRYWQGGEREGKER